MLAYNEDERLDGFKFSRNANYNCVCYQITKSSGIEIDEITAFLNGYNVTKPSSAPTIATGTLAFLLKNEKWLTKLIEAKNPKETFNNYMAAIRELIVDPNYNLAQLAIGDKFQFYLELVTQFIDLLIFDVRLCLPVI